MARMMEIYAYKFDELPEATQTKIIDNWRTNDTFFWADEWRDSLNAFADHAPLRIRDWSVGYPGTFLHYEVDDDAYGGDGIGQMEGVRAWKWLMNNGWGALANPGQGKSCPFTGYCGDESLLDPIREALANPAGIWGLRDLFRQCFDRWAKDFEADIDHWHSAECIREEIEANGYEFYDDGVIV
jgi:hypothetical protein